MNVPDIDAEPLVSVRVDLVANVEIFDCSNAGAASPEYIVVLTAGSAYATLVNRI